MPALKGSVLFSPRGKITVETTQSLMLVELCHHLRKTTVSQSLETLAVVWAVSHFHAYLYGSEVTVFTDHSAVRAILQTPNPTGKHARWWAKVFSQGVKHVNIVYRAGKDNVCADALSRNPYRQPSSKATEGESTIEVQVTRVSKKNKQSEEQGSSKESESITDLLQAEPSRTGSLPTDYQGEQRKDPGLQQLIQYLEKGELPTDQKQAQKLTVQAPLFTLVN